MLTYFTGLNFKEPTTAAHVGNFYKNNDLYFIKFNQTHLLPTLFDRRNNIKSEIFNEFIVQFLQMTGIDLSCCLTLSMLNSITDIVLTIKNEYMAQMDQKYVQFFDYLILSTNIYVDSDSLQQPLSSSSSSSLPPLQIPTQHEERGEEEEEEEQHDEEAELNAILENATTMDVDMDEIDDFNYYTNLDDITEANSEDQNLTGMQLEEKFNYSI